MQSDEKNSSGSSFAKRGTELDLGLCDQQCQARDLRSSTEGWPWINIPQALTPICHGTWDTLLVFSEMPFPYL